jgi:hypothetical protein
MLLFFLPKNKIYADNIKTALCYSKKIAPVSCLVHIDSLPKDSVLDIVYNSEYIYTLLTVTMFDPKDRIVYNKAFQLKDGLSNIIELSTLELASKIYLSIVTIDIKK